MANQFFTSQGVLTIPGTVVQTKVQQLNSGLATTGVMVLVGEAASGPDYTHETDVSSIAYGPDELSSVMAKYGSGNLVDAFNIAANPSSDPQIQGALSKIYVIKTNASLKASGSMLKAGLTSYGTLYDQSYGDNGNNMYFSVAASAVEVPATTGAFTFIPTPSGSTLKVRLNGATAVSNAVTALAKPTTVVGSITSGSATGLNALANVLVQGGIDRAVLSGLSATSSLTVAASGNTVVITLSGAGTTWGTVPTAGDTLLIPSANLDYGASAGSAIKGGANATAGAYVVTSASALVINATKLRNPAAGALTPPVNVGTVAISATPTNDLIVCSPVTLTNASGTDRGMLTGLVGKTLTGTNVSGNLVITLSGAGSPVWAATPQAGDRVFIPSTSPAAIANAVGGWWSVVSATTTTVTVSKLSDFSALAPFGGTVIAATTDVQCLRPMIDGIGKTLELYDGAGTDNVSTLFYNLSATQVTWLSTSSSPQLLTSATEQKQLLSVTRNNDGVLESCTAGGEIALQVGYQGTTATITIGATTVTTTVTGGSGANLSFTKASIKTISDLVARINSNTGYTAAVGSALYGQLPPSVLDLGTFGICSDQVQVVARLKKDGYEFFKQLSQNSSHVQLGNPALAATAGLPDVQANTFLSGGALGGTTAAAVVAALVMAEKVKANFVATLFSRDAADDLADGKTDSASTYAVDAVNAALNTHCLNMSKLVKQRPRLGLASKRTTFAKAKLAASNLASARVGQFAFQDVKGVGVDGVIHQYQPWAAAVLGGAMQGAGFYKLIFNKALNISGALQAAGDFQDTDDTQVTDALLAGLNPIRARDTGGFAFTSDQTTYTFDNNFVYNSLQAMYVADVMAMTFQQRLNQAFIGQSFADLSAALIIGFVKGLVADLKRLKLVGESDSAPEGYAGLRVTIAAPAATIELAVVEATGLYFIPVTLLLQQVQQTATG